MSQVQANASDTRTRYFHSAYDVTTFGKSPETGPSGYKSRLSGTYEANILLPPIDAGLTTAQVMGDVGEGLIIRGVINHRALTTGTLTLDFPAHRGEGAAAVTSVAVDLTTAGVILTGINEAFYLPLTIDRPMTATVTLGTASETALISLLVTPIESGWK